MLRHFAALVYSLAIAASSPASIGGTSAAAVARNLPASSRRGLIRRAGDPTDVCVRWSHQSALVNGSLYLYGGRSSSDPGQSSDTWNNDFLTLPLKDSFKIGSPTLKGLSQPSGPPAVANGYLWHSTDSLFLYGGEFSDKPSTSPTPFSLWEYDVKASSWKEHADPKTSQGQNSEPADVAVQRAAEGAGFGVPELGRGWYFGGHLDGYTTPDWSQQVERVYLKSLIEYTFPGYSNAAVDDLKGGKTAGEDGAWRNITQGGLQEEAGFTERADGVLVYIPGFSKDGIILGLGGGTNATFTQMNVIDVFDVATSTWYKQATSGASPKIRVNPCAVVAAAADGSSFNIYMYGGQNLIPYGKQIQYDDMWILTVPSFTWIRVDTTGQANPPGRAGHTCDVYNSQMIVVGGYVGQDLSCDSPGIYVFDLSSLKWETQYTAVAGSNSQNRQASQTDEKNGQPLGLSGSYGYKVPSAVQSVIGGNVNGGATATAPAQGATSGPLATGKPPSYAVPGSGPGGSGSGGSGARTGAIVAGTVAGFFAIVAGYFAFCAWVYRRQLALYKNHVAMVQRQSADSHAADKLGYVGVAGMPRSSGGSSRKERLTDSSSAGGPSTSGGYASVPNPQGEIGRISSANSSTDDLIGNQEPTFLGVLLSPRRSLRVINKD